jgi:hypothetical protein
MLADKLSTCHFFKRNKPFPIWRKPIWHCQLQKTGIKSTEAAANYLKAQAMAWTESRGIPDELADDRLFKPSVYRSIPRSVDGD